MHAIISEYLAMAGYSASPLFSVQSTKLLLDDIVVPREDVDEAIAFDLRRTAVSTVLPQPFSSPQKHAHGAHRSPEDYP